MQYLQPNTTLQGGLAIIIETKRYKYNGKCDYKI